MVTAVASGACSILVPVNMQLRCRMPALELYYQLNSVVLCKQLTFDCESCFQVRYMNFETLGRFFDTIT